MDRVYDPLKMEIQGDYKMKIEKLQKINLSLKNYHEEIINYIEEIDSSDLKYFGKKELANIRNNSNYLKAKLVSLIDSCLPIKKRDI